MHLACVLLTEGREPISNIGYESWLSAAAQFPLGDVSLCIGASVEYAPPVSLLATRQGCYVHCWRYPQLTVPQRFDDVCRRIFERDPSAIVLVWDDDDYSPAHRLSLTQHVFSTWGEHPVVTSYDRGYFVNLRTLHGHLSTETGTYQDGNIWGGCIAFNKAAFDAANGFEDKPFPGYDARFAQDAYTNGVKVAILETPPHLLPIAFSHGSNVCTWMREPGHDMRAELQEWLPTNVWEAVTTASQWLVDKRIFPPWS